MPGIDVFTTIELDAYQGILLDLDNTLYAYRPAHQAGHQAMMEYLQQELQLPLESLETAFQQAKQATHHQLFGQASSHSRLLYAQGMLERLTGSSKPAQALAAEEAYWSCFLATAQVFPQAKSFLERCREEQMPICLVTDLTAQIQLRKLEYWSLSYYIRWVVSSEEIGHEKPHPAMFRVGLQKLGIVPEQALMIGDNFNKDIIGAQALGIATCYIE